MCTAWGGGRVVRGGGSYLGFQRCHSHLPLPLDFLWLCLQGSHIGLLQDKLHHTSTVMEVAIKRETSLPPASISPAPSNEGNGMG